MAKFHGPKVYGTVTVGGRGQVVIPAQLRQSYGIKAGDKLIVFSKPKMISLMPAEEFNEFLNETEKMLAKFRK